jgi:hypothetical protein
MERGNTASKNGDVFTGMFEDNERKRGGNLSIS